MNATDMITTDIMLPRIGKLEVIDGQHRIVAVEWASGKREGRADTVDLSPLIDALKFYRRLREDAALFQTAEVIRGGSAIAWGEGDIDMAATSIERLAEEAMTGKDFANFLARNNLTHQGAAASLGRSKRQIENYLQAETLPRLVALACLGYEARRNMATNKLKYPDLKDLVGELADSVRKIAIATSAETPDGDPPLVILPKQKSTG